MNTNTPSRNWIYASVSINSFGGWLTFIAIAMLLKERFGSHHVATAFLIQSIPSLLLSSYTKRIFYKWNPFSVLTALSIIQSINVFIVAYATSLSHFYIYMIISSTAAAFKAPLIQTLIAQWVKKEELRETMTRVGSINSIMLTLAPPIGGAIAAGIGFKILFLVDAITFIAAWILLLNFRKISKRATEKVPKKTSNLHWYRLEEIALEPKLRGHLLKWYSFLMIGALFNGVEFYIFESSELTRENIGFVLGCWGAGNLLSFLLAKNKAFNRIPINIPIIFFSSSFLIFVFFPNITSISLSFFIGGMCSAIIAGNMRSNIHISLEKSHESLSIWGLITSRAAGINCIFYGGSALLIQNDLQKIILFLCFFVALSFAFISIKKIGREMNNEY